MLKIIIISLLVLVNINICNAESWFANTCSESEFGAKKQCDNQYYGDEPGTISCGYKGGSYLWGYYNNGYFNPSSQWCYEIGMCVQDQQYSPVFNAEKGCDDCYVSAHQYCTTDFCEEACPDETYPPQLGTYSGCEDNYGPSRNTYCGDPLHGYGDGIKNGDETGVDCGGVYSPACDGSEPPATEDPMTCGNGFKDFDETGVDCEGVCSAQCYYVCEQGYEVVAGYDGGICIDVQPTLSTCDPATGSNCCSLGYIHNADGGVCEMYIADALTTAYPDGYKEPGTGGDGTGFDDSGIIAAIKSHQTDTVAAKENIILVKDAIQQLEQTMGQKLTQLTQTINNSAMVGTDLSNVENSLNTTNSNLSQINSKIDGIENSVNSVKAKIDGVNQNLVIVNESITTGLQEINKSILDKPILTKDDIAAGVGQALDSQETEAAARIGQLPTVSYEGPTEEDVPDSSDLEQLLETYRTSSPVAGLIGGTRIDVVGANCSLDTSLFNQNVSLDFCDSKITGWLNMFGRLIVMIAGLYSVFLVFGKGD